MIHSTAGVCPKCGETVTELLFSETVTNLGKFTLAYDHEEDAYDHHGPKEYHCPSCAEVLFNDVSEASAFLRGTPAGPLG
jgi:hypothetical protein